MSGTTKSVVNNNKASHVDMAKYTSADGEISRVFFKSKSFSVNKGATFLKAISKKNLNAGLIFTGGGFFQLNLPPKLCKSDYLENNEKLKKYINDQVEKVVSIIKKKDITIPIFFGIDFIEPVDKTASVQLGVYLHKGKFSFFSKQYPVIGEKVIDYWSSNEEKTVSIKKFGKVLLLVCNDVVLWGGRSEKLLGDNTPRSKLAAKLKREFKSFRPNLVLNFIHEINSGLSGRAFSNSITQYNLKLKKHQGACLGAFGSGKGKYLKSLANSKQVPSKIKSLSADDLIKVTDFYIY